MATIPPETGDSNVSETTLAEFPVPPSHQIPAETSPAHWRRPMMETALECYAEAVGSALGVAARASTQLFDRVPGYTQGGYSQVERESKNLGRRVQENAWYVRERYPLQALSAIAGTAFLVGIALRVWRSRAS